MNRLNTVSLRLRVIAAVMAVLAAILILLSIAVNAIFIAQSNRNLNTLLAGQAQLARQLARSGAGPQQIVNRVQAGGVQAYLVLRTAPSSAAPVTQWRSCQDDHHFAQRAHPGRRSPAHSGD